MKKEEINGTTKCKNVLHINVRTQLGTQHDCRASSKRIQYNLTIFRVTIITIIKLLQTVRCVRVTRRIHLRAWRHRSKYSPYRYRGRGATVYHGRTSRHRVTYPERCVITANIAVIYYLSRARPPLFICVFYPAAVVAVVGACARGRGRAGRGFADR